MTSTSFNVGLTETTRLSSRVLRPPGGGHTDIFGGEPEPTRGRRPAPAVIAAQQSELQKQANAAEEAFQNGKAEAAHHEQPAEPQAPPQREERAQIPVKTESAPVQLSQPEPPKAEAPKRVRVPPGGFSSGLW